MRQRVCLLVALFVLWAVSPTPGQDTERSEVETRQLLRLLDEVVDLTKMDAGSFGETLVQLREFLAARGKELPIVVNHEAFKKAKGDALVDNEVALRLPREPKRMKVGVLLRLMAEQCEIEATFLVRNGTIELLPVRLATPSVLLQQRVAGAYENLPLESVLRHLSNQSGLSIALDHRVADKGKTPITLTLRNDITLKSALRMVAEMAELKVMLLPEGAIVTTSQHAETLQKELAAK